MREGKRGPLPRSGAAGPCGCQRLALRADSVAGVSHPELVPRGPCVLSCGWVSRVLPSARRNRLPTATPISPIFELVVVISNDSLVRQPKQRQRSPPAQSEDLPPEVWLADICAAWPLRGGPFPPISPPRNAHLSHSRTNARRCGGSSLSL